MKDTNTLAHLKLIELKNGLFRIIGGFTHERLTQRSADWTSTDFKAGDNIDGIIEQAKQHLRTNNVVAVNGWYTKNSLKWGWKKNLRDNWNKV